MRRLLLLAPPAIALASCVPSRPVPQPVAPPPPVTPALPAAAPQQDWRDVPLTPGRWAWRGTPGASSIARYGEPDQPAAFTVRCDFTARTVILSRDANATPGAAMTITTSFAAFAVGAQIGARDPRLDQIAFSRGRFLVDAPGQPRLVLPAWPEVARVIEDCRG